MTNKYGIGSREIKFRVWYTPDSEMWDNDNISEHYLHEVFDNPEFISMQYTGLKDKNGKEIYEGDVVENEEEYKAIVFWDRDCFALQLCNGDFDPFDYGHRGLSRFVKNLKVIGNIFENPELLTNNQ